MHADRSFAYSAFALGRDMMRNKLAVVGIVILNVLLAAWIVAQEEKPHWTYEDAGEAGPP